MSEVSLIDGHIDNGMSDEEIIKILKYCEGEDGISYCNNCPLYEYDNCVHFMSQMAREFINRYKAENEKLNIELKAMRGAANSYKAEVERLKNAGDNKTKELLRHNSTIEELHEKLKNHKSEAIKDVLLTLETAVEESNKYIREYEDSKEQRAYNQAFKDAYNLVKEMTESK